MVLLNQHSSISWKLQLSIKGYCNGIKFSEKIDYFRILFSLRSALTSDINLVTFFRLPLFYRTQYLSVSARAVFFKSHSFRIAPATRNCSAVVRLRVYCRISAISTSRNAGYIVSSGCWLESSLFYRLCQQQIQNLKKDTLKVAFRRPSKNRCSSFSYVDLLYMFSSTFLMTPLSQVSTQFIRRNLWIKQAVLFQVVASGYFVVNALSSRPPRNIRTLSIIKTANMQVHAITQKSQQTTLGHY